MITSPNDDPRTRRARAFASATKLPPKAKKAAKKSAAPAKTVAVKAAKKPIAKKPSPEKAPAKKR